MGVEVIVMIESILTKGEEEILTANLSPEKKESVIKWAKQARLDNYLLNLALNKHIEVGFSDNPGLFFKGESEELNYLVELRKSIL